MTNTVYYRNNRRRKTLGCKEQLITDQVKMKQAKKCYLNLYTAYIDYRKAFDSVPHSWLIQVLKMYQIDNSIIEFLIHTMKRWKTTIRIKNRRTEMEIEDIKIKRGIFQGDALSSLWFCLALNPLSNMLNNSNCGYIIHDKRADGCCLSHLLYMDDIKLYAKNQREMNDMMKLVHHFSTDIKMSFGLEKCKTVSMVRGKHEEHSVILQDENQEMVIEALQQGEVYKYLGIEQNMKTDAQKVKCRLKKECNRRIESICKAKLNGKNFCKAINTLAIPVLTYSFGIIKWSDTEIEEIQRKIRTTLTRYR